MGKLAAYAILLLLFGGLTAKASLSPMTGAILLGAETVYRSDSAWETLDRNLRRIATQVGEACLLTEHYRYRTGLSYLNVSMLQDELRRSGWRVEEIVSYIPFSSNPAVWLASKRRDIVIVLLLPVSTGVGYVSFCLIS
ncbi:MAG: hypothetical protein ACK4G4_11985 [Thermus sp.]|uniref:hypothetical protein n=1 Tax=Thermus sp. TaxID=275 RepID=UPI00391D4134